jgi:hypothetical protein
MSSKITKDKVYNYLIETGKLVENKETTFYISHLDTDIIGYIIIEVTYKTKKLSHINNKSEFHIEVSEYRKWDRAKKLNKISYD